jgi:hypothetical protein
VSTDKDNDALREEFANEKRSDDELDHRREAMRRRELMNFWVQEYWWVQANSIGRPVLGRVWPYPDPYDQEEAYDAILDAEHRDYALLAKHLRDGRACREEMQVAADILERKIPPKKKGKPPRPSTFRRYLNIADSVRCSASQYGSVEAAVAEASKDYDMTPKQIYAALEVVEEAERALHDDKMQDHWENQDQG